MTQTRKTALVTGASGGIGEAIARELAKAGHNLVLVARTLSKLEALGQELAKSHNISYSAIALDLSDPKAAENLVKTLNERKINVDVLVNNAGFSHFGLFHEISLADNLQLLQVNIVTLTELTHRLLPGMLARRYGRIMNVASTAAFMPGPLMSSYYASKAYVLSLSEALNSEYTGTGVTVTALCPGPTESGFQARAKMEDSKLVKGKTMMTSAAVAVEGVEAMLRGQAVVIPGLMNQVQASFPRFMPRGLVPNIVKNAQAKAH
jgi:uncharacterized protein